MKKLSLFLLPLLSAVSSAPAQSLPIVFVTQVPPAASAAATVTSIGNNHLPSAASAPRGGDLMIRYPDGSIRYLTREAGFGSTGTEQSGGAIAVRDPHIHWSGQRILFSMVINGSSAYPDADRWQLYEATGFQQGETLQITRVPNQPAGFNNVQPCYAPDDRIIYVSDRTLDGTTATYPATDEKGQGLINTGLWSLHPQTGDLMHMEHSPSGSFDPVVDSYGRVLFTRWDHLQRDEIAATSSGFDYSSEAANATFQPGVYSESFPETLNASGPDLGLRFDLFMPWTVNPDGTDLVTLNHVGRQEISPSAMRSRADANLVDLTPPTGSSVIRVGSLMHLTEHPVIKGRLFGTDAVMNRLSAGRIVTVLSGAPTTNPSNMLIRLTTGNGILRDPAVTTDGKLLASVATGPNLGGVSYNGGGATPVGAPIDPNGSLAVGNPFVVRVSVQPATVFGLGANTFQFNASPLVSLPAVTVTVTNQAHEITQTFSGPLWQLQPVEVRPTVRPVSAISKMDTPEQEMFISAGVSPLAFKSWLRDSDLALMTVRNVTQRDGADHQQPTNLEVPEGVSSVKADGGPSYQVKALQILQGKYLRGYPGNTGRRIKATTVSAVPGITQPPAGLPGGSTAVAADGSVAALVPATRATSWQLIQPNGAPVVRERYWLSFQAGEIRSCTSCHGVNTTDQLGRAAASNPPAALRSLLESVKQSAPQISESSTYRILTEAALGVPLNALEDDDADGTSNLVEWAMGSSPIAAADKPVKPLTVSTMSSGNQRFAGISFSRTAGETHSLVILEGSSNLRDWRSLANLQGTAAAGTVTGDPGYLISRTLNAGGKSEMVTLTSTIPTSASPDRYFRLRVSAQ